VRTIHSRGDVKRLKLETSHRARRLILIFHLKICREHAVLEILGKVTSFIYKFGYVSTGASQKNRCCIVKIFFNSGAKSNLSYDRVLLQYSDQQHVLNAFVILNEHSEK